LNGGAIIRILFCLGEYYKDKIGGAEVQSLLLSKELIKRGHEVSYLCNGDSFRKKPFIDENGIKVYRVKKPIKGHKTLHYLHKGRIYNLLDSINPQIIYQRGDYHFMDIMSSYGKSRNVPVVSALSMERHCHRPMVHFSPSFLLQIINVWLIERYYRLSSAVICQTLSQQKKFKKNFNLNSIVIPIGHPVPTKKVKKEKKPLVLWVANIKPIKRPELFIELAQRMRNSGMRFVMIGRPDEKGYQQRIDSLLKNNPNIEFLGELDLYSTNDWISKACVLVNTSESEGFSNTFVQAWMRETPVLSMNTDPDSMISKEGLGAMVADIDDLDKKIRYLVNNPDVLKTMGEKSKSVSYDLFNINTVTRELEKLFIQLKRTY